MKEKYFIIEPLTKPVKGYYLEGDTWNGWEQPRFERSTMLEIIEKFKKAGYRAWEDEKDGCFVIVDDPDTPVFTIFKPLTSKIKNKSVNLYKSTGSWTWEPYNI
ncbi:hypothetical protein [Exiguobacterium sp. AB2]|uniref:hypothetical protein n=1 Tax=Exiguobacterium sp. AB2 TaxID=1484479 RepID=UPI0004A8EC84|nr:hypothetical protein [Exiguobacterium sp. AB2]KDN57650.1 hypothetical protein DI14_10610 [Exiguobacterium sp. AB2]